MPATTCPQPAAHYTNMAEKGRCAICLEGFHFDLEAMAATTAKLNRASKGGR